MALEERQTFELEIERATSRQATVKWKSISNSSCYMLEVQDKDSKLVTGNEWIFQLPGDANSLEIPFSLTPGCAYSVTVKSQKMEYAKGHVMYRLYRKTTKKFRAVFTSNELNELHQRALNYVGKRKDMDCIQVFYRNKPPIYWDNIDKKKNHVMEPYLKDNNGDPASIINGRINGLFFATNVDRFTKLPPIRSYFGERRFSVPAAAFFADDCMRLYFADFYCNNTAHYVTLVMTSEDSEADKFCREELIRVEPYNNPFLRKEDYGVLVTTALHVEVFYTDAMNIPEWITQHNASFSNVEVSYGTSVPGGLPKNKACKLCNLYPNEAMDPPPDIN